MSSRMVDLAGAARMIQESNRILFFLHVSPDGDSIGATLGMVRALRQVGKEAIIVGVDPVPRIYQFLPGWDTYFVPWQEVNGQWDLACFLDCGDLERVGDAEPVVKKAERTLNVDHHATNTMYGDFNYLDYTAAAVGEQAYRLLREMGLSLDAEVATCLYTSIVADTGSFRYDSTRPATHRIAADLIELGAKPYEVASALFENESVARIAILSRVLATLQVDPSGKIAWVHTTLEMLEQTGAKEEDAEGVVNYARSVSGVEVGLSFRETPEGVVRVGFRSRRFVDVGKIATRFGGGGHARAAGCSVVGQLAEVEKKILNAVREVV